MKTVCHVISGYFRNDARVFKRQCLSLKEAGYEVSILTNDGEPNEVLEGINIYACEQVWPRWKTLLFALYQFKKQALQIDADIYQLHSPELLPLGVMLKKMGKTVIYDAHEDMPAHILEKEWLPQVSRKFISVVVAKYMNRVYRKIDEIVSPHSHVVQKINEEIGKGVLVANFPLIKALDPEVIENVANRDLILCYSGTVYAYSNQEATIEAISSIDNAVYEVAGYMDEQHQQDLLAMPGSEKSKFHGRIDQVALRELYLRSLIGVVIYDYKLNLGHNLGSYGTNKIFEYMEAGLPIICTDYILWKEIIDEYKCGIYVKPGDVAAIASAINTINGDRELARTMGINARKAAEEKFNWVTEKKKYITVFNKY
ncbi:glycosyltransferase family 4 protein [Aliikangiella coralliicola]|uniref:Glycosyltransferase family 4 protein n=1 Tax=Aliikangiella coralliicola TaxID=2592383 RepID=A0A545U0L6_9GAMM|nr:glycosyltransferase family 4 protein [Aliikangiella coralliicola]TQV83006.1 glycosyltransferase family 4 protein [Aliikangiella coralliicola]